MGMFHILENVYYILLWYGYGGGLTMISPHLYSENIAGFGYPLNCFDNKENLSNEEILKKHGLEDHPYCIIIRNPDPKREGASDRIVHLSDYVTDENGVIKTLCGKTEKDTLYLQMCHINGDNTREATCAICLNLKEG